MYSCWASSNTSDSTLSDTSSTQPSMDSLIEPQKDAIIIILEEMVDRGMADYVKRAISQAVAKNPDVIIFEVNTFGGRLDAAFDIVDYITDIDDSIKTVAYVNKKAISAGALISLAANELYMKPTTTIGDCAPVLSTQEGPKIIGEKIQSPLRAKFRNLAEKNNYPKLLSQAMVSPDLEIIKLTKGDSIKFMHLFQYDELKDKDKDFWDTKETIVRMGELLTLTNNEAERYGFSKGTFKNTSDLMAHLKLKEIEPIKIHWAESLARTLAHVAPILMLIGFGALYLEFKTPGFGVFGIIGIIALCIVFGGQYISGFATNTGAIFLFLGVVLMLVEMFILPGTFIAGALGVLSFIVAISLTVDPDIADKLPKDVSGTDNFLQNATRVLYYALGAIIIPILGSRFIIPMIPSKYGIAIHETLEDAHATTIQEEYPELEIGLEGITKNLLRPSGKAVFLGKTYDVDAQSGFIEANTTVKIISIQGQTINVVKAS